MLVAYSVNARLGVKERLIHIYVSYHAVNVPLTEQSANNGTVLERATGRSCIFSLKLQIKKRKKEKLQTPRHLGKESNSGISVALKLQSHILVGPLK